MEHDPHTEPVTLNYASARRTVPPNSALIILVTLASITLCPMLYSTFVTLTAPCCTGCGGSSQTKAEMASLSSVLALYQLHLGAYPTSLDDLVVRPSGEAGARWKGPYVENPGTLRDTWGRPLRYKSPGVKNLGHYDLWSAGPDGVDGTADDINNW